MNVLAGVILITAHFIINRKVVAALWGYATDTVKSFMEGRKNRS